jgi:hypothetical protein
MLSLFGGADRQMPRRWGMVEAGLGPESGWPQEEAAGRGAVMLRPGKLVRASHGCEVRQKEERELPTLC